MRPYCSPPVIPLDFYTVPLPYGLLPLGFLGSPPTLWVFTLWISRQSPYHVGCYPLDFLAGPLAYGLLPFGFLGSPPTFWVVTLWLSRQSPYLMVCYPLDF